MYQMDVIYSRTAWNLTHIGPVFKELCGINISLFSLKINMKI